MTNDRQADGVERQTTVEYGVNLTLERGSTHIWAGRRIQYWSPKPTSEDDAVAQAREEYDGEIEEIRGVETREVPAPEKWDTDDPRLMTDGGKPADGVERSLVTGDVFELLPELDDNSAHCAVVDYPWDFDKENGAGLYGEFYETEPLVRFENILDELARVLVDGAWLFAFADDVISAEVRRQIEQSPFERRQTCVWDFGSMSMGAYHRVGHYPILTATNGETERYVRDRSTIYRAQRSTGAVGIGHERSTAKPVSLFRKMLEPPVLRDGERLLEPFAGTAPGLAVCQERGLGYWGADTDAEIVDERRSDPEPTALGGWST